MVALRLKGWTWNRPALSLRELGEVNSWRMRRIAGIYSAKYAEKRLAFAEKTPDNLRIQCGVKA
jgi:hypothetical protein